MNKSLRRIIGLGAALVVGGFVLMQLVPYGRNHTNPAVINEPNWDSAQTRDLAERACFACHSNETVWPWYSNVAPISWLTQHDTDEGRQTLNFSNWGQGLKGERAGELSEVVGEGEMPPVVFLITHPEARLTTAEKEALAQGLQATARN